MKVNQIYDLVNSTVSEVLGKEEILNEDLTNIVDVGKEVIDRIKTYSYLLHNGTDKIKTVVKYAFKNGDDYTDTKLFLTEEEAEARCKELNKEG